MNIFFMNIGRRCELVEAFARVLPALSPGLIWGSDPDPLAPALAVADRIIDLPRNFDTEEFPEKLADFLVRENIGLVIPTIDPDLVRLDSWRDFLKERSPGTGFLLSPSPAIKIARDKKLSKKEFARLGAEVPESVDPGGANLEFPLFVKPAAGSASIGALRVETFRQLENCLQSTQDPIVEKFVPGDEITVDVLMDMEGNPLHAVPRRRIQVRGGEVSRGIVERSPELEKCALSLAEGLGCTGPVTIQFRNPVPGRWVAMEINARMGGGLPLSIKAGARWPEWIIRMALGHKMEKPETTALDGVIMTRADRSFFLPPTRRKTVSRKNASLPPVIIFDMDDTLYPEAGFVRSGYRAIAERVWADFRIDMEPELHRRFSAGQRGDLMSSAFRSLDLQVPDDYVRSTLVPVYRNHIPDIRPYVETVPVLSELLKRGHRLALLSDGWAATQKRKFSALGLEGCFEKILFTDDLGRDAWKPSTRGFEHILEAMGIDASDAVYVGDNPSKDFLGARKAGLSAIRICRPGTEHCEAVPPTYEHEAQRTIFRLTDLISAADTGDACA